MVLLGLCCSQSAFSQMERSLIEQNEQVLFSEGLFQSLNWRNIGPFRGGRSNAVVGVRQQPMVYYMGTVGGGVWKTEDAGISWNNITDGFIKSASIGAIAVAKSDPNTLYIGTGEHAVRGVMSSAGDGVYKSTDAGKTWVHIGLAKTKHISRIIIHPENPETLWVAAQGATFGRTRERGVYKSVDGGENWEHVLYINNTSGASDISIDQSNPRILYVGMWDHQRTPWLMRSGGTGSGLYKSTDGGNNWEQLSDGLPEKMGKTSIAVSPANPNLLYANIEADKGGVFRSKDAGTHWEQVSDNRSTIARAWYYTRIIPDPVFEQGVYVLNAPLLQSLDGGKTFEAINNPHTDQHDLWINPDNPKNMILANDGGACITFNGGKSWSSQDNQPTAQLYRIIADKQFPYHVYAGQQDNSSIAIPSRTSDSGIDKVHTYPVAGGESAFIALDPDNPDLVYGTSFLGNISVYNHQTGLVKDIMAYPNVGLGSSSAEQRYRFNWNAPLISDPFEPKTLYHGAQVVLKSTDGGFNWSEISPDLSQNQIIKQGLGGGPFTNEGAGGEVYNTISYLAASPIQERELWVGTDDGLVHFSPDGGATWNNVSPPGLGEALVNAIEVSRHHTGRAYVSATRYKFDDPRPLVFQTSDYGKTWVKTVQGISENNFVRVVREDQKNEQILYAGTESGLYISFDQGTNWNAFQLNLPLSPITDLFIRDNDLIASTAGRAIWILDDLSPIQQSTGKAPNEELAIYLPKEQVRMPSTAAADSDFIGSNPEDGVAIDYFLPNSLTDYSDLRLRVYHPNGSLLRTFQADPNPEFIEYEGGPEMEKLLSTKKGFNRFYWDFRRATLPGVPKVFVLGDYRGGMVAPETYTIVLSYGNDSVDTKVTINPDPRLDISWQTYQEQEEVLLDIENKIRDIHNSVNKMRTVKVQIQTLIDLLKKSKEHADLVTIGKDAINKIEQWEALIIQTKQQTFQDVINYPNQLSAEYFALKEKVDSHDPRLTQGAISRLADLNDTWTNARSKMQNILEREVDTFNKVFKEKNIPALIIPQVKAF